MRRVTIRVPAARAEEALDVLLALLPHGVHRRDDGDVAELVALCDEDDAAAIPASLGEILDEEAGELAEELDRLRPVIEVAGHVLALTARSYGFGTGAHPTTRMCLALLATLEPSGGLADLGCGAGAIVIAAAKLGWSPVHGIDHSALALRDARANCEANGVEAQLHEGDLLAAELPAVPAAVANVGDLDVHARLAGAPFRTLVVSGLRTSEIDAVLRRYTAAGFTTAERRTERGWAAALLRVNRGR